MTALEVEQVQAEIFSELPLLSVVARTPRQVIYRTTPAENGRPLIAVVMETDPSNASALLNRLKEAEFLPHPNLAPVLRSGSFEAEGATLVYFVTEAFHFTFKDVVVREPFDLDVVRELVLPITAALSYLHRESLVYCALQAGSIWNVGGIWKLADYSELRMEGKYRGSDTRHLLIRPDLNTPPEAYEGLVSSAWDAWSLGLLLNKTLAHGGEPRGDKRERADNRNHPHAIPAPLGDAVRELLETDPVHRLSVNRFAEELPGMVLERATAEQTPVQEETAETAAFVPTPSPPEILPGVSRVKTPGRKSLGRFAAEALGVGALVVAFAFLFVWLFQPSVSPIHVREEPVAKMQSPAKTGPKSVAATPAGAVPAAAAVPDTAAVSSYQGPREQITAVLNKWVDSTRERNVDEQVECYAPVVDQLFGAKGVSSQQLRKEKERIFSLIGNVERFEIKNVTLNRITPTWAVVSFDKTWNFPSRHFSGSTKEEMVLRPFQGAWKISSEREIARTDRGARRTEGF